MTDDLSHIFLSPHLDDAVLSCGGTIYQLAQAGQSVRVITVFAGDAPPGPLSPFAQSLHDRWQADPAARRVEDVEAMRRLGAEAIHWPYADAVYRRDPITGAALYDSEESIFGEVVQADAVTIESIARRLAAIDPAAKWYVPLTAGHHVDHQIVRAAAESPGRGLIYYEDTPYAEASAKLEAVLRQEAWSAEWIWMTDAAIRVKAKAINAYSSQIGTFFKDEEEVEQRVRAYARLVEGESGPAERLWHRVECLPISSGVL